MGNAERVILVKGDSTKWYNQAIFIVSKDTPATKMPVDFVAEAEKIIYNHMVKEKKTAKAKEAAVPGVYTSHMKAFAPAASSYSSPVMRTGTKKNSKFDVTLNIMMIMACIAIAVVFAYGMMS